MRKWQFIFLAALLGGVAGCGGGGGGGDGGVEEIIRQAEQTSGSIAAVGEEALVAGTPEALAEAAATIAQEAGVSAATATTHSLTVEYENGGTEVWVVTPPRAEPVPVAGRRAAPPTRELVGSQRAVIFNAIHGDPQFAASNLKTAEAGDKLQLIGYTVDRLNGAAATVQTYKGLAPYGVVVFDGHGETTTFQGQPGMVLQTGQEGTWAGILLGFPLDWARGRVTLMNVRWGTPPQQQKRFLGVTDRFFRSYYLDAAVRLPHSLVYSGACSSQKNNSLADALYSSGAAVYVGWSDPQSVSSWTLVSLFEGMTDGTNLAIAVADLPDQLTHQTAYGDAWLQYYPGAGGAIQLRRASSIAFTSNRDGIQGEIYVMNADGSNQTRLTNNPAEDYYPSWSPDGRKIAFTSDRDGYPNWEIYVMNSDGSNQTNLTNNPALDSDLSWSPDGSKIAFYSHRDDIWGEIYVMNSDGSNQTRLTNDPAKDEDPSWSPDGSKIAFWSSRDQGNYEIYVMNSDGTNQTRLTNTPAWQAHDWQASWSPDGSKIAFSSYRDVNWEIYVMNSDGSNQTRLTNNPTSDAYPYWSPDGSKIAFTSQRDGNWEIYVMNSDGSNQTRLTNSPAVEDYLTWSPDGRKIAFFSDRDGNREIYVMNSDGSNQTNLTNNPAVDVFPSWSPWGG